MACISFLPGLLRGSRFSAFVQIVQEKMRKFGRCIQIIVLKNAEKHGTISAEMRKT